MIHIKPYFDKRTLILGDVNSGKTEKTRRILQAFVRAGYAEQVTVLDLSPDPVGHIGGKIIVPPGQPLLHFAPTIFAPRLSGKNPDDVRHLAFQNARAIEKLFPEMKRRKRKILFINDATLYFHAGDLSRFMALLDMADTQVINAYWGDTFPDSALTQREKRLTLELKKTCDEIVYL